MNKQDEAVFEQAFAELAEEGWFTGLSDIIEYKGYINKIKKGDTLTLKESERFELIYDSLKDNVILKHNKKQRRDVK